MMTFETGCYWGYQSQVALKDRRGSEMDHRPHTPSASYHRLSQNRITTSPRLLQLFTVHINAYTPYARQRDATVGTQHNSTTPKQYIQDSQLSQDRKVITLRGHKDLSSNSGSSSCSKNKFGTWPKRPETNDGSQQLLTSQAATRELQTTRRRRTP